MAGSPIRKIFAKHRDTKEVVRVEGQKYFRPVYTIWPGKFEECRQVSVDASHPYFESPGDYWLEERDAVTTTSTKVGAAPPARRAPPARPAPATTNEGEPDASW